MKKSFISLGLIAATVLSLTNCTKEIENPAQEPESAGIPFEIVASTPDTKTTNDGLNTVWAADDAVNVFHAEKGSTTYLSDGEFTLVSGTTFSGSIASELTADEYDWYVYYPYSEYNQTPAGNSSDNFSYQTIAQSAKGIQTQIGNNSKAHLAGENIPMYGKVTVAKNGEVAVDMKHLVSVIELTVTNNSTKPIKVSDVVFTAEQNIVGTYYIDFTGNQVKYTQGNNANHSATLRVVDGEDIAVSQSAKFYLAIKPFDAQKDDNLKISVNGYEKELTLSKDVSFQAGKIKKLNFDFNTSIIYSTSFDYNMVGSSYNSANEIIGTDKGTTTSWGIIYGNWNGSNAAQMRVYKEANFGSLYMKFDVSKAQVVSYKAKTDNVALTLNTYYSIDGGNEWIKVDEDKSLTQDIKRYSFTVSETGEYNQVRVKFEASGAAPASSNYQLTIDDVVIYGNGSVLVDKNPTIVVENTSVLLSSLATETQFVYSLIDIDGTPSIAITSDVYSIIDGIPVVNDGVVLVNLNENDEEFDKTATLTLSYAGADDVVLTITQSAYIDMSNQKSYKKVSEITSGEKYLLVAELNGNNYIFDGGNVQATTSQVSASTLLIEDKIISNDETDSYAVTILESVNGYQLLLSTNKYLVINESSNSNGNLKSAEIGEEIDIESKDGKFLFISTNRNTRGLIYRDSAGGFKNYAVSNASASGYCGYLTLYQLEDK